jgi:hypothetical protein
VARAQDRDTVAAEYNNELERIADAKARYVEAGHYARYAEQADIAEELAARRLIKSQLEEAYQNLSQLAVAPPPPQQTDQLEAWITTGPGATLLDADKNYLRERREFLNAHPDNAELLLSAAKLAEKRYQLQPGTPEYHEFLDREAGVADADNIQPSQPRKTRKQGGATSRRNVAAPVSRSSSSRSASSVHLTEFDQDQARQLGMSFRDYAEIKNKANQRKGQLTRDEAGGRLHFRATFQDSY